jgi:ribosomal protein S18 acetylase RimI-like enzyme
MEINIRQVTANDLDACHVVETACFPPMEAAEKETIALRIAQFPQGFLVAELDGQIAGMLNSGCTNKEDFSNEELKKLIGHDADGRNLVVFSLAVHPKYQKHGIAKRLMLRFFEDAKKLEKEKVLLLCKQELIGYYQRLGFVYLGESKSLHGGSVWHEMSYSIFNSLTH